MSGWWAEHFADFTLGLTPVIAADVRSVSKTAMALELTPNIGMDATATSTGEFGLVFDPSLSFAGEAFVGTLALNLDLAVGMLATGTSTGAFDLTLTPTIGMVGAEHYTATFALALTLEVGQIAYVKQLPHPIPWTL